MATRRMRLRYVSVGLTAAVAGVAWADTLYMHSTSDGSVYFASLPMVPRYAAYSSPERRDRRRRPRQVSSGHSCSAGPCDKSRFDRLISDIADGYGIESALLHAVIAVESSYNPNALSPSGAAGLMQLMPGTAKRYGVDNALDPEQNLRGGARYLRDLLQMFGSDISLAIAAYHAGEMSVARNQNRIPPFGATMDYVLKVLDYYQKFRSTVTH